MESSKSEEEEGRCGSKKRRNEHTNQQTRDETLAVGCAKEASREENPFAL